MLFNGGTIGGWSLSEYILQSVDANGGVKFDSENKQIGIRTGSNVDSTILEIGRIGGSVGSPKFGIEGKDSADSTKTLFKLGEDGNEIAGWTITNKSFDGGDMHINKSGFISASTYWQISASTISTDPIGFISSSALPK